MTEAAIPEHNEARGRGVRADEVKSHRRRRKSGTLNRMAQYRLDIFGADELDLENYVYRWVNDEDNRLRMATKGDDYDHVGMDEIKGLDSSIVDSEGNNVRMLTGRDKAGNPVYSYLLKKPRVFFEHDMEENVIAREDMMKGIVHRGDIAELEDVDEDGKTKGLSADTVYVPEGNQIGGATRRRGPVPRRLK